MAKYVAGGIYKGKDPENTAFTLVRPGGGFKPYVWSDPLPHWTHTEHHAHLYVLSEDGKTATLYKRGEPDERDVEAPKTVQLTPEQIEDIRNGQHV